MPGSNTGHLPQTLVGFPGQLLCVPPAGHTLEAMTLGHSDDINHLVLGKNSSHGYLLLEVIPGKLDLVGNGATIKLDLHNMSLLLPLRPVLVEPPLGLLANVLSPPC